MSFPLNVSRRRLLQQIDEIFVAALVDKVKAYIEGVTPANTVVDVRFSTLTASSIQLGFTITLLMVPGSQTVAAASVIDQSLKDPSTFPSVFAVNGITVGRPEIQTMVTTVAPPPPELDNLNASVEPKPKKANSNLSSPAMAALIAVICGAVFIAVVVVVVAVNQYRRRQRERAARRRRTKSASAKPRKPKPATTVPLESIAIVPSSRGPAQAESAADEVNELRFFSKATVCSLPDMQNNPLGGKPRDELDDSVDFGMMILIERERKEERAIAKAKAKKDRARGRARDGHAVDDQSPDSEIASARGPAPL